MNFGNKFLPPLMCFPLSHQRMSGKKKAHKRKLFGPVALGTTPGMSQRQTEFVPRFPLIYNASPVCPWDKPSLSLGQSQGRRAAEKVYVLKVYVPFSLARMGPPKKHNDIMSKTSFGPPI